MAAEAIVRVFTHPCAFNRGRAVEEATEQEAAGTMGAVATEAIRCLRKALGALLTSKDDSLFTTAVPALIRTSRDDTLRRVRRILFGKDSSRAQGLANVLVGLPAYRGGLGILAEWLSTQTGLTTGLPTIAALPGLLPIAQTSRLVARALADESPAQRTMALRVLVQLPSKQRKKLVATALRTEPDPGLRKLLKKAATKRD